MNHSWASKKGFTIVELLIVIVIISILAAITVVAYNGIQRRAQDTKLKSDLTNAAKQMEIAYVYGDSYPTTLPSAVKRSDGVILSLSSSTKYCINAELSSNTDIRWYYDAAGGGIQAGSCSGSVLAGSESGVNPNLITNTNFGSGWSLSTSDNTGRALSVRAGTAGDPYPSRPVLVLSNNNTTAVSWGVVTSTEINRAAIASGKTYMRSFYVRKVGAESIKVTHAGVLDPNGSNVTLPHFAAGMTPVSSSWQKVSTSDVAVQNAPPTNRLYLEVSPHSVFTTSGWKLEFQGFELREQ